jgi:hypothetical protein
VITVIRIICEIYGLKNKKGLLSIKKDDFNATNADWRPVYRDFNTEGNYHRLKLMACGPRIRGAEKGRKGEKNLILLYSGLVYSHCFLLKKNTIKAATAAITNRVAK